MEHPSETFLSRLEQSLMKLVKESQMAIIQSSLACLSAVVTKQKRSPKIAFEHFRMLLSEFRFLFNRFWSLKIIYGNDVVKGRYYISSYLSNAVISMLNVHFADFLVKCRTQICDQADRAVAIEQRPTLLRYVFFISA